MRKTPWVMYLWPGLPQLWFYGSWAGLVTAVVAAAIFDLLLLGSFGWVPLFSKAAWDKAGPTDNERLAVLRWLDANAGDGDGDGR